MKPWVRGLDIATNVAVLIASCLFAVIAWRIVSHPQNVPSVKPSQQIVGTRVNLPSVTWQSGKSTVVLALSTECHFCSESKPFYRQLISKATADGVKVVAVLPQSPDASKKYLDIDSVAVAQVVQQPLSNLNVSGTPTLLLVDSQGIVTKTWIGKLDSAAEKEVLAHI